MPQTVESINHAKAANVKLIVAMNKMDKPTANPERVMEGLTKYGIITEDWGGDVACIPVSALDVYKRQLHGGLRRYRLHRQALPP